MKWNMIIGAVVLSVGLCGQSFGGGGLLNKLLGQGGCGCGAAAPSCGCDAAPSCGCEAAPSCGCDAAPACGSCALSCGCGGKLTGLLGSLHGFGCCSPAPSCGCGGGFLGKFKKCGSCCPLLKLNLPKLGGCGCGCAAPSCGCDAGCDSGEGQSEQYEVPAGNGGDANDSDDAPEASDAAPMPPAPLVDPSALVPSKRRIIAASAISR